MKSSHFSFDTPSIHVFHLSSHFLNCTVFSLLITMLSSLHPFNFTISLELKNRLIFLIPFIFVRYCLLIRKNLHAMDNTPLKKVVTHRFEPTSKYVLLFIGGLALSLVISIWGNLTQRREHQDWEEADLKYRALKMVLPSNDPNIRYIEKHFSVQRDENIIDNVRNRVIAYEDSVRHHYEMRQMAAYKDNLSKRLSTEAKRIKEKH